MIQHALADRRDASLLPRLFALLVPVLALLAGCTPRPIVVAPDYGNFHYDRTDLHRPGLEVVEVVDDRDSLPELVGKAQVGVFNNWVNYRLTESVSEFVARSVKTIVGADPQAEEICPVTIHVDLLSVDEHTGMFQEKGAAACRLVFSFPVDAESTRTFTVYANRNVGGMVDVTGSLEDVLYECVADCTRQFVLEAYDPAPGHLLVARDAALAPGADRAVE